MSAPTEYPNANEQAGRSFAAPTGSADGMRASLAAIHYHATRPTCPTTTAMDALLLTIRDECERCIPALQRVRPNGEHEPREAAASGSRMRTDKTGCLPLAQCSGWAEECAAYQSAHLNASCTASALSG
jgi:hypothetical protein